MGARRRLLSIYIHLFSPLSREWSSPLKKQLLVSGQPQEFPPPSAHTSGSRCCNRESQGLCVCASDSVSITEKLCWKRSVFSFLMNLNSEDVSQKCTGSWSKVSDWSKSHGRWGQHVREKGWHHFLFSGASIAPTRMSVAWTGKYWFLFTFIILLLCVCTYMTECIPHMHVYVWGQLVKLVSLLPCGYWGPTSGWPGLGASTFTYWILLPAYLFSFEFSVTFNQEIPCWLIFLSTMSLLKSQSNKRQVSICHFL